MQTIEDFLRSVFSYTLESQKFYAAALRSLKKNLESYIRPEFFDANRGGVRLDNILVSVTRGFRDLDNEENI